ncbi:MAG TPA: class I SAM-dependent methyltransferase [Terriglobia bacterium]|nr:class I SAM-dependent methyltransferase [Terriglobia bacterium]
MQPQQAGVSPAKIFDTLVAHQQSDALKAAIELDLFTAVGEGHTTAADLARRCGASPRGVRILADYLTILGFLTKQNDRYGLSEDSALFLDRRSPAYMGGVHEFIASDYFLQSGRHLAESVRKGGTAMPDNGAVTPEHPMWVTFARAMMPMMMPIAQQIAARAGQGQLKVLDIAAGHGIYGILVAKTNPEAHIVQLDWPNVLEVARGNAAEFGVADRIAYIEGSAFKEDYGSGYDLVLLTNFLHHFDAPTIESLLRKVHAALKPGGRVMTVEFVPNDDRITPPQAAGFALIMLQTTDVGDAYTFAELDQMLRNAGFERSERFDLSPTPQTLIISNR